MIFIDLLFGSVVSSLGLNIIYQGFYLGLAESLGPEANFQRMLRSHCSLIFVLTWLIYLPTGNQIDLFEKIFRCYAKFAHHTQDYWRIGWPFPNSQSDCSKSVTSFLGTNLIFHYD